MIKKLFYIAVFILSTTVSLAQEIDWEAMLEREVEVENPVYKPVLGIGGGMMSYWGDIKGTNGNLLIGQPALKFNISTFADNKHNFKFNFYFNLGNTGINNPESSDTSLFKHSAFSTRIQSFGVNLDYGFNHFFKGKPKVRPFLAVGVEFLSFNARGNLFGEDDNSIQYFPWDDGTIRNYDQSRPIDINSNILIYQRDNSFETNFTQFENYAQQGYAIPVEAGFDISLADRATLRIGSSLNFTFSDFLDGYQPAADSRSILNNDRYLFTYATLSYDLWSDPETMTVKDLMLELGDGFDFTDITSDLDNDFVLDFADECPETPFGIETDTAGCPFDDDKDGVPNYLDKELNTPEGVFVDKDGVTMTVDDLIALLDGTMAINRENVFKSQGTYRVSPYAGMKNLKIPQKYKFVDLNGDGYISFIELLDAIDAYFDFNSPLSSNELQDLNDFFFAQ